MQQNNLERRQKTIQKKKIAKVDVPKFKRRKLKWRVINPLIKRKENEMYRRAAPTTSQIKEERKRHETAKKSAKIVSAISSQKENWFC